MYELFPDRHVMYISVDPSSSNFQRRQAMPMAPFTGIQACLAGCQQVIACTRHVLGLAHSTCALGLRLLMIRARIECTLQNDLCK